MNYHQDTKNLNFQGFSLSVEWVTDRTPNGECHLAVVDLPLKQPQEASLACLSNNEQEQARRLQSAEDRQQFVERRVFQRCFAAILSDTLTSIAEFPLLRTADGAPYSPALPDWSLSFSSTQSLAIAAASRQAEVGIDAELVRTVDRPLDIAKRFFAPEEVEGLALLPQQEQEEAFLKLWSAKEACLKLIGRGMVFGPDRIIISRLNTAQYTVKLPAELGSPERWHVETLGLRANHIITLATRRSANQTVDKP